MASPDMFSQLYQRFTRAGKTTVQGVDLVLPQENPRKPSTSTSSTLAPAVLSIDATAQEQEEGSFDHEEHVLLKVSKVNSRCEAGGAQQLRWMHLCSNDIEFKAFVKCALEVYGISTAIEDLVCSKLLRSGSSPLEVPAFQGKRFVTAHTSAELQLPGHAEKTAISFLSIPFFLLQTVRDRIASQRSSSHWVQPLVQSAYHLDSSLAREHQQAIRRLHHDMTEIVHIPELWVLAIGERFVATCSPTPLYDDKSSSISTHTLGGGLFPPTIRVTMSSGFVFCINRDQCDVWFKFLYRVQCIVKAALNLDLARRNCEYRLEKEGKLIEGRQWQSILQSHPHTEPLLIRAIPEKSEHPQRQPAAIALEGKYAWESSHHDTSKYPRVSTQLLSTKTLDVYRLPYYWDTSHPGARETLVIAQNLTDLDLKILYDHTRRLNALGSSYVEVEEFKDPYYAPPSAVLEAARSQVHHQDSPQTSERHDMQPIFRWLILGGLADRDRKFFSRQVARKPEGSSIDQPTEAASSTTPTQRMRALSAHMHREILFLEDLRSAQTYNKLSLKTKADVDQQITALQKTNPDMHLLALFSTFVRRVGQILDCFIDSDYDCVVKHKVWAALYGIVSTLEHPSVESLFPFHCDILSIPLREFHDQILDLHHGSTGTASPGPYITRSMVWAFIEIVILLTNSEYRIFQYIRSLDDHSTDASQTSLGQDDTNASQTSLGQDDTNTSHASLSCDSCRESILEAPQLGSESSIVNETAQDNKPCTMDTASSYMHDPTADSLFSGGAKSLEALEGEFSRRLNDHIDRIYSYLIQSRQECCIISCSHDEVEDTYNGVDRGKIVALVMDSVLRGHSTCATMSTLDIVEVYATYTTQLQLQARNSPTKGLLIHLNLLREELDIVMSTIRKQFELTQSLCKPKASDDKGGWGMEVDIDDTANRMAFEWLYSTTPDDHIVLNMSTRKLLKAMQASLQEKIYVLDELVKRAERLEQHIVQRVDIIQEDHGKATLIFTIVATIFLPLSFVTSYLGMNTADIRNMDANQAIFWEVATPVTVAVVVVVLLVAYNASRIVGLLPQRQV